MHYSLNIRETGTIPFIHLSSVDFSDFTTNFSRETENLRGRVKLGNVSIYGNDYDILKAITSVNIDFELYENGELLEVGEAELLANEDVDYKMIKLALFVNDIYTSFDEKGELLYNINETPSSGLTGRIDVKQETERLTYTFTAPELFDTLTIDDPHAVLYWVLDLIDLQTKLEKTGWNIEDARITWQTLCQGTGNYPILRATACEVDYMRYIAYGRYDGVSRVPPQISGNWVFVEDIIINNTKIPKFGDIYISGLVDETTFHFVGSCPYTSTSNHSVSAWYPIHQDIPPPVDIGYNLSDKTFRRYDDVIKFLVGKINPLILFDNTDTITDSFYSNKTITSSVIYIEGQGYTNDLPYKDLMTGNVNDIVPTDAGQQGSELSTLTETSFNRFMLFFEKMGFYWYVENRSGQYYFMLRHYEHRNLGNSNEKLNYLFTDRSRKIETTPPTYSKIINNEQVQNINFVGTPLFLPKVKGTNESLEIVSNNIFVDVDYIVIDGKKDFDPFDSEQLFMFACYNPPLNTYTIIRPQVSLLTNVQVKNSELSFSWISQKMMCNFPEKSFEVNGNSFIADDYRIEKRRKISLTLPENNIKNFDLLNTYKYLNEDVEILSVARKGEDNFTNVTILK